MTRVIAEIGVRAAPLAYVVRDGVVESVHHGHLVGLDGTGTQALAAGDPDVTFFPRSSLKPVQAVALKILDGSRRPVRTVVVAALRALGVDEPGLLAAGHVAVLGHGVEVGRVEAALDGPTAG